MDRTADNREKYIPIVKGGLCCRVFLDEIVYIEATYRRVEIHTLNEVFALYGKIEAIEGYLDSRFCHFLKNLIVNFDEVERMEEGEVLFFSGDRVIIGRTNFIKAKQKFANYIINYVRQN